ncbi:hypothetical protein WA026_006427 [Henosepilachna vigintioctopunctata]|uniref:Uncharacterized protein n=1 Tax=Henosepilachna vigintioctopunctata TaxID=420089 RepID=A0AAW1TIB6_9CUCU
MGKTLKPNSNNKKTFCQTNILKLVYLVQVQPHLFHRILAWGRITNLYWKKLDVIQKWILKIIYNKSNCYCTDIDIHFSRIQASSTPENYTWQFIKEKIIQWPR